ncbi:DNA repair protein RecN [Betaproteobacteria bacterium]|nr:DNA repair protein RecN [Betaproteobacteria bacterium]
MLRNLEISNFVFVKNLCLEFASGFNIFSGETGSGKSIIVDALAILLGKRATLMKIREGCDQAVISAFFEIPTKSEELRVKQWFKKHSFDEKFSEILLRRVLDKGGKSRCWVNGQLCALNQIKELGDLLVEINGQHAHQKLMSQSFQRDTLDEFGELKSDVENLRALWFAWQKSNDELIAVKHTEKQLNEKKESLSWKVQELENLNLESGEWEKLSIDHKKLGQMSDLISTFSTATRALNSENGVVRTLESTSAELRQISEFDPALNEVCDLLEKGTIEVQEACIALRKCEKKAEIDEERATDIERRFNDIMNVSHKVRERPDKLFGLYDELKKEFSQLEKETDIKRLESTVDKLKTDYFSHAKNLSERRIEKAKELSSLVTQWLKKLSMGNFVFDTTVTETAAAAPHGTDEIFFSISQYRGSGKQKINQSASGGELSRIMLAITMALSKIARTPTIIFDEIDAGIGGNAADSVGEVLKQLGMEQQIFCITHLPQIAARGENHFSIRKSSENGKIPVTEIRYLNSQDRVDEIARMLGNEFSAETSVQHATSLLRTHGQNMVN